MISRELLYRYCKDQFRLFHIPIHIFEGGKRVETFDEIDSLFNEGQEDAIAKQFYSPEKKTRLHYVSSLLMDGAVFSETEDLFIYFGYVRCSEANRESVRSSILQEVSDSNFLTEEFLADSIKYLKRMPRMNPGRFAALLSSVYLFLNGKAFPEGELYQESLEEKPEEYSVVLEEKDAFEAEECRSDYESEQLMLFYVRHGMFLEIERSCKRTKSFNWFGSIHNHASWSRLKNYAQQALILVSRAAIEAGGNLLEWYKLQEFYTERIELADSIKGINEIRYSMLMDYARRVFALKYEAIEDEMIFEVVRYVLEHLGEKISLEDLSKSVHMSRSHLCSKFKKCMGVGLNEFINDRKIEKAKQLLRFTSLPLIDIATELNYCSQSYFQQIFRARTGMTPLEYRNKKR